MNKTFSKGEYVIYGVNGVCYIDDIKKMSFSNNENKQMYYILKPVENKGSLIFIPLKNDKLVAKLRYLFTMDEIDCIIEKSKNKKTEWIEDKRQRGDMFHKVLSNGLHSDILAMIRCIHARQNELIQCGKHLTQADECIAKSAENMINGEFSFTLGIKPEDVSKYIKNKLCLSNVSCESN